MKLLTFSMLAFAMLSQNSDRLVILPRASSTQPKASVAGTIVSEATGAPLAGATITLSRKFGNVIEMLSDEGALPTIPPTKTDEKGRFSFPAIEAAAYNLSVQLNGYMRGTTLLRPNAGQLIDGITVRLIRSAVISGRVRDSAGVPLANVPIQLYRQTDMDSLPGPETRSSADGTYRLENFLAGNYVLTAGSPIALNGEPAASFAKSITVPNVETVTLDIPITATERYALRGKALMFASQKPPATEVKWSLSVTPAGNRTTGLPESVIQYNPAEGNIQIQNLAPGLYHITSTLLMPQQVIGGCGSAIVVLSQADINNLQITLRQCM